MHSYLKELQNQRIGKQKWLTELETKAATPFVWPDSNTLTRVPEIRHIVQTLFTVKIPTQVHEFDLLRLVLTATGWNPQDDAQKTATKLRQEIENLNILIENIQNNERLVTTSSKD